MADRLRRPWFAIEPLAPRTWLIAEPGHANCFLVEGDDLAVLVDTGLGLADIAAAARTVTDRPVLVVNTHSHSDHRGGNHFFTHRQDFAGVAAHPLAQPVLTAAVDQSYLRNYLTVARQQLAAFARMEDDDRRFFHVFTDATTPRPLPEDSADWQVPAGPPPRALAHEERLDLGGGRQLTVLHTPGHSPDSICLVDEAHGLLFAGDTLITGDFWAHTPDTEFELFAATLRWLCDSLADSLAHVFPAHTLRYRVGPEFLRRAADGFADIAAGRSAGIAGADLLGRPAERHEFSDFTVLRPLVG